MENKLEFRDILRIIKKRYWILLITIFLSTTFSAILTFYIMEPIYRSYTTIIIKMNGTESGYTVDKFSVAEKLAITDSNIIKSKLVIDKVISELNLDYTYGELYNNIEVVPLEETQILRIAVLDKDPELARDIAQTTTNIFMDEIAKITSSHTISILDEAAIRKDPIKPNKPLNMTLGVAIGFLIGLVIIFLLEYLNTNIKNKEDIEKYLGLDVIGEIPKHTDHI